MSTTHGTPGVVGLGDTSPSLVGSELENGGRIGETGRHEPGPAIVRLLQRLWVVLAVLS